jgi:hypothetical protein
MSTFFFKTNITTEEAEGRLKQKLDSLQNDQSIQSWKIDVSHPEHLLQINTIKLSSEEVKHLVREAGVDADFTKAPQVH